MNAGSWFLGVAVLAAGATVVSSLKLSCLPLALLLALFITSLMTTELSVFMVVIQALVSLVFIINVQQWCAGAGANGVELGRYVSAAWPGKAGG